MAPDTPMFARAPDGVRSALLKDVNTPKRFGKPEEFAALVRWSPLAPPVTATLAMVLTGTLHQAKSIIENPYLNGVTIRLDGGIRMSNL